jgi:4-hydroxybutyrate CoA-transferase
MAVMIVCGVDAEGRREILAVEPMLEESKESYSQLFQQLRERGLSTPALVISDAHAGLVSAIREGFPGASWQRCKVHFMRNILAHIPQLFHPADPKSGEIEQKIASHCASLIQDGACLQLGIGGIPDAVLGFLTEKNDLGIHSEMLMTGSLTLLKNGNINNTRKQFHNGVSVVTFLYGSEELYEYAHLNPKVEVYTVDYVNNPINIAKNDNMVSINSAVSVDFMGQICADTISADRHHSGAGGFVDFIRGASFSKNGISIVAMPSTAAGGKASRITAQLEAGRPVTLSRFESHYIVTEYGIANMRGKTLRQRARNLIEISHPDFRDQLKEDYERLFRQSY